MHYHDTFNKDVIVLPGPSSCSVIKQRTKQKLHEQGHILNVFEFQKSWDQRIVTEQISVELLMSCGNRLISPKLRAEQELDANLIHKVYKSKALYIRPSKPILDDIIDYSCEDDVCDETRGSARQLRSSSRARPLYSSSDCFPSTVDSCTPIYTSLFEPLGSSRGCGPSFSHCPSSANQNISPSHSNTSATSSSYQLPMPFPNSCLSTSQPSASSFEGTSLVLTSQNVSSSSQQSSTPGNHSASISTHHQYTNYESYLSVMAALSDASSDDEELNQAILESLHTESTIGCSLPVKDILEELATKINHQKRSKFNINRTTVLDGAVRGFKRGTYDPCHTISVRFSDDMGVSEEAVDLGGPRREFLRLLMESLSQSSMFEGDEGKMNLAFDSSAMREDKYFIAGRAIAVSLVHGGPPASFLSPTLFSCLVNGPEFAKPTLEDVADRDIREKIKMLKECQSFEDMLAATKPLEDYLANVGCLRLLRQLEHKYLLVDDILMFQVIHRVCGPFERFRDGLKTLGVLDKIQAYPDSFRPLLCWSPTTLSADVVDGLFTIRLSPGGSNRRRAEEVVAPFWRDYLTDAEDEEGTQKLELILAFATGANAVPPIGFSPQPSIEFLHQEDDSGTTAKLPIANTCINCLKLPLHTSYRDFQENMDFALGNNNGFGML